MSENVDNLVLEQLRPIRETLSQMQAKIDATDGKVDDLGLQLRSVEGVLFGLGGYIRSIDQRVEHLETKLGA